MLNPGIHVGLLATVHHADDQVNNMMVLRGTESLAPHRIGLHPRGAFWYLRWSDRRRIDGAASSAGYSKNACHFSFGETGVIKLTPINSPTVTITAGITM